jgi:hypothetical protein
LTDTPKPLTNPPPLPYLHAVLASLASMTVGYWKLHPQQPQILTLTVLPPPPPPYLAMTLLPAAEEEVEIVQLSFPARIKLPEARIAAF